MHSPLDLKKRKKGTVYVWGCNESSQLGLGAVTDHQYEPVPLTTLKKAKPVYVASGSHFCAIMTSEGQIYTWGKGESGQLGLNDYSNGHIPQRISLFKKKKCLLTSCGDKLTLSIPADKSGVFIWGEGTEGQHGINQTPYNNIPSPICIDVFSKKKVISIGAGTNHCCCVVQNPSGDTDVYSWGQGDKGKLGNNSEQAEYTPYLIEALRGTRVVMVSCGSDYTAVLTERGHVYTWGGGDSGRLGIGNAQGSMVPVCLAKLSQVEVVEISCGPDHMAAVTSQGKLFTWGYGSNGRLGLGEESDVFEPTQVLDLDNEFVVSVCCGGHHTAAITQNGLLYTFGWNYYGQLGLGMVNSRKDSQLSPCLVESLKAHQVLQVSCGEQHTLALVV